MFNDFNIIIVIGPVLSFLFFRATLQLNWFLIQFYVATINYLAAAIYFPSRYKQPTDRRYNSVLLVAANNNTLGEMIDPLLLRNH